MKKIFLLLAVSLLSTTAVAQMGMTTKQECNRRCVSRDPQNSKKILHEQRLKQIRDRKQAETDPQKIKALSQAESEEIDRHQDELENMCRDICQDNPEA
jgi:hypothetical protein